MPNPKAARIQRTATETEPFLTTALRRLRQLGATPDEIEMVETTWAENTPDWNEEQRRSFLHLSDAELRKALQEIRDEFPYYEEQRGEALDVNPGSVVMGVEGNQQQTLSVQLPDDAPPITASIARLEDWVGDDKERAQLVRDAEIADSEARGQTPRATLLTKMQRIVDE